MSFFDELKQRRLLPKFLVAGVLVLLLAAYALYLSCRIDVPPDHIAVLIRKTGHDLDNGQEVAPDADHKGVQAEVLGEGRYFYNPYGWTWEIHPMQQVPEGK